MRLLALVVAAILSAACASKPPAPTEPIRQYKMRGEVLKLDPPNNLATIRHQPIEGWMGAMTMDYLVKDKSGYSKLKKGDYIAATVYVQGDEFWIGGVHPDK